MYKVGVFGQKIELDKTRILRINEILKNIIDKYEEIAFEFGSSCEFVDLVYKEVRNFAIKNKNIKISTYQLRLDWHKLETIPFYSNNKDEEKIKSVGFDFNKFNSLYLDNLFFEKDRQIIEKCDEILLYIDLSNFDNTYYINELYEIAKTLNKNIKNCFYS